jgi:hypothetical protein
MTKLVALAALLLSLSLAACGSDDDEAPPVTYSCKATVSPVTLGYLIAGRNLQVSDASGASATWPRVGSAADETQVYGTWHVDTSSGEAGTASLDIRIDADRVTAIADCDFGSVSTTASASSPAIIDGSTITILQADEDTQYVTR